MSCRTSTTRAYKSRRASPAELGEQARARALRGPTGKGDESTDERQPDGPMHGHGREGKGETGRRQVGRPLRDGFGTGWGSRVPSQFVEPRPEAYTEPRAASALAPGWRRSHLGTSSRRRTPEYPRLFLGPLRHHPKKVERGCWRPRCAPPPTPRSSGDSASLPLAC